MKHFIKIILTVFLLQISGNILAQTQRCHTMEYIEELKKIDPYVPEKIEAAKVQARAFPAAQKSGRRNILLIPVVVHVLHNGEAVGVGKNISDAQIHSQINVLNEDYRAINSDISSVPSHFTSVIGNPEMEFCLAAFDPQGNPTSGINRVFMGITGTWNDSRKPTTIWDSKRYLNIWVSQLSGGTLAYATFPGSPANYDGVVIDSRYFGTAPFNSHNSKFNLGRTATHEVGHWLGLDHTFLSGCSGTNPNNCSTSGDRICDTPPTRNANYGCTLPLSQNTCTETPVDLPDMWMNFLDYMDDACLYMFTQEQTDVMRNVLYSSRSEILGSFACNSGKFFSFASRVIDAKTGEGLAGAKVLLQGSALYELETDASGYFSTPNFREGIYAVYAGKWGYLTAQHTPGLFIDSTASAFVIPLERGYYDDFLFDFNWNTHSTATSGHWVREAPVQTIFNGEISNPGNDIPDDFGDKCYVTGNGGGTAGNDDVDDGNVTLTSPAFDLTDYSDPHVSYYRWFFNAGGQGPPDDELTISISNGIETVLLEMIDANIPNTNRWIQSVFRVKDFITPTNNMRLIVETGDQPGTGHLVEAAFDGFEVRDSIAASLPEKYGQPAIFHVYPNPASGFVNIEMRTQGGKEAQLLLYEASGRLILQHAVNGSETFSMDVNDFPRGIYYLKLVAKESTIVRKVTLIR